MKRNNKIKHSIKVQVICLFIALIAGIYIITWFINNTFLEDYYLLNKETTLKNAYDQINDAIQKDDISSNEFEIQFEKIYSTGNLAIVVIDSSGKIKMSSVNDGKILRNQLFSYFFNISEYNIKIVENQDDYIIQKVSDARTQSDYLEMWGVLNNGNLFIIRTAMESIQDSVNIANRFLAYVGIFAILTSSLIISFFVKKITYPILELTEISKKMIGLDFDAKYKMKNNNEIDILGSNINILSETLEQTISKLKTANNELQKDIEEKNEIDEMRKEFISNVSHELKTPIALIQGYAEGLKEVVNEDEESKDFYCEVIMDEAGKMNKMVKSLLTLNQLEFGNDKVYMERFDITVLIQGIIQSYKILIMQKDVNVIFNPKSPIFVWGDEFKVEEVIVNYFINALNHVDNDMIIEIKIKEAEDCVRISVFNTGKHIPEESIDNIWTKFYKVDKARTREYGGSGIGLSIVKAIMDSFNRGYGVINYENGVEFWFELDK